MKNKPVLNVIFRKEKHFSKFVIAAYFNNATARYGRILCYTHEEGHNEADVSYYVAATKKAEPEEYADLLEELKEEYSDFEIVVKKRMNYDTLRKNWRQSGMELFKKGTTPDGIKIQLEKWNKYNHYIVVAYPTCKTNSIFFEGGKPFRLGICFNKYNLGIEDCLTSEVVETAKTAAETCFSCLESGEKFLENYSRYFWNGADDIKRLTGVRQA